MDNGSNSEKNNLVGSQAIPEIFCNGHNKISQRIKWWNTQNYQDRHHRQCTES